MQQTKMEGLKNTAKSLFMVVPIENSQYGFCQHPFTNQVFGVRLNGDIPELIDYSTKEGFEIFKKQIFEMID